MLPWRATEAGAGVSGKGEPAAGERAAHPAFQLRGGCSVEPPARRGAAPEVALELPLPLLLFRDRRRKHSVTAFLPLPPPSLRSPPVHDSAGHVKCGARTVWAKCSLLPPLRAARMLQGQLALPACCSARAFNCLTEPWPYFSIRKVAAQPREKKGDVSSARSRAGVRSVFWRQTQLERGARGPGPQPPLASYRMSDHCCPVRHSPAVYQ